MFRRFPVLRGMLTYAVTWSASNVFQQVQLDKEKFSINETMRFTAFGSLFLAPTLQLATNITSHLPFKGNPLAVNFKRCVVLHATYYPMYIASFFLFMEFSDEDGSLESAMKEMKEKFLTTYAVSTTFWLPISTLTYTYISLQYRVSLIGTLSFFWGVFLSVMKD